MNELSFSLGQFWVDVALHLWQTGLFVGLLALLGLMLRDAPARLLSWLYWCGIAKLLLPLPWLGGLSARLFDSLAGVSAAGLADGSWGRVSVWIYPVRIESDGSASVAVLWLALTALWLFGVAIGLLRRLRVSRASFGRFDGAYPAELSAALDDAALDPDVVRIGSVPAPFVSGRTRPVIVLPERLVSVLSREELGAVLVHEREHLHRRDTLRYELLFWVRALFWFYPPVWWLALRIRQTTEMACDEAVVRAGFSPAAYCRSLARTVEFGLSHGGAVSPVGILGHGVSFLRRRLRRIRSERRYETMLTHRVALAAAAVAALAVSLLPIASTPALLAKDVPSPDLSRLADADLPVMLNFQQAPLEKILDALSHASGVEFEIAGPLPDRPVDFVVSRTRLADALTKLGRTANLKYRVLAPDVVEVRPVLLAGVGDVTAPRLASKIPPVYPEQARKDGVEGKVVLQAVIDDDGRVAEIEVLNSTDDVFDDAAVDAVRQWRWEPATSDGKPVTVYFTIVVQFSLNESGKTEI